MKAVDYAVFGTSVLVPIVISIYHTFTGTNSNEQYFFGARSMRIFPVSASLAMILLSSLQALYYPVEFFYYGVDIFLMPILIAIAIPLSTFVFIPMLYNMKLDSVYEYFELRFESKNIRWITASIFLLQQLFVCAQILYLTAKVLSVLANINQWIVIVIVGFSGTLYSSFGGYKTVAWSSVFQYAVVLFGMTYFTVFLYMQPETKSADTLLVRGRLDYPRTSVNPFQRYNVLNIVLGYGIFLFVDFGTNPAQVQRYSSLSEKKFALRAMIFTLPLVLLVFVAILCFSIVLYSICQTSEQECHNVYEYLAALNIFDSDGSYGNVGLISAVLVSISLASYSAFLNTMTAIAWNDIVKKLGFFKYMRRLAALSVSKIICGSLGMLAIAISLIFLKFGWTYARSPGLFVVTNSAFCGVFLMAMFMPCINKFGAIAGLIFTIVSMTLFTIQATIVNSTSIPFFANLTNAPVELNLTDLFGNSSSAPLKGFEHTDNFYFTSYLLYPFLGILSTIVVGFIVSTFSGGFCLCGKNKVIRKQVHPMLRVYNCCLTSPQPKHKNGNGTLLKHSYRFPSQTHVDRISSLYNLQFLGSTTRLDVIPPKYSYQTVQLKQPDTVDSDYDDYGH